MTEYEALVLWSAVTVYAAATVVAGFAVCCRQRRALTIALALLVIGAVANTAVIGVRWIGTEHGPFLGRYEAFASHALAVAVLYLLVQAAVPTLRGGSMLVAPVAFLLLGVAALSPAAPTYPSPALQSHWLTIHVSVTKLALATVIVSGVASLIHLVRRAHAGGAGAPAERLDVVAYRLLGYTFFLMSVVILSGSLWASVAWGSFWSWDPVETWSLAFWAACAFTLHLRSGGGWTGQRWAKSVLALTALGVATFVGYGHFGVSLHAAYVAP